MRLRSLFPGISSANWPWTLAAPSGPPYDPSQAFLDALDALLNFTEVETAVSNGVVGITAKITSTTPIEFVTSRFPSFRWRLVPDADWSSDFRASVGIDGLYTMEIDAVPLQLSIPADLLSAHPSLDVATSGVTLSSAQDATIQRTFRLRILNGQPYLEPHTPISLGPCRLFGVTMRAVHDWRFVATPGDAYQRCDWIVRPLDPNHFHFDCGALSFGGLLLDSDDPQSSLAELFSLLNISSRVEWVFEDIVIPALFPAIPQHGTFGLRRPLLPGESLEQYLVTDAAVIRAALTDDVSAHLTQLFLRTLPEPAGPLDGLSLEGGVSITYSIDEREDDRGSVSIDLGIIDGDLVRFSLARTAAHERETVPVLHFELFGYDIDFIRVRIGVAASKLGKGDVGGALYGVGDLLIRERPSRSSTPEQEREQESTQAVTIQSPNDQPFEIALVDAGWDRGKIAFAIKEKLGSSIHLGPVALTLSEIGLVQQDGATYFVMSGGLEVNTTPFDGGLFFKRLRFRLWGAPDAPQWALDGFGGRLAIEKVIELELYGFFGTKTLTNGDRLKENGLSGKLILYVSSQRYGFAFDLAWGELFRANGSPKVDYFMLQVFFEGQLALGPVELRTIRMLFANNMKPDIQDAEREAGELIYYEWHKRTDPTRATPEERLNAWAVAPNAFAFGFGFGMSFVGCGGVCLVQAFGLGFDSEDDDGLMIALEVYLLGSAKPLAIGVFEYDPDSGKVVILIAFDISLDKLINNFPEQLAVKLSGTIVFGNQPGLVAFGRLEDEATWLGASLKAQLAEAFALEFRVAICFEWQEGVHVGGGLISKLSLKGDLGLVLIEGWGSFGFRVMFVLSGSGDYAARIAADLGFALTLFRFLRIGVALELLAEWLAHAPDYFAFRFTLRLETPWFLPDVSVSFEHVQGAVEPATRDVIAAPLVSSSALAVKKSVALRIARADGLGHGDRSKLLSVQSLRDAPAASFVGGEAPVPLDAVIAIELSSTVADTLGLGEGPHLADAGVQVSGDDDAKLEAKYELVGLEVRRRPRGSDAPWVVVESLSSSHDTPRLRWQWDASKRVLDALAPKTLLLNGSTPFFAQMGAPEVDAAILRDNPRYPCCSAPPVAQLRFDFHDDNAGPLPGGFVRTVKDSSIVVRGGPCIVRAPLATGAGASKIGAFTLPQRTESWSRTVFQLVSPEDLALVKLRVALSAREAYAVSFRARKLDGSVMFEQRDVVAVTTPFTEVSLSRGPFRILEVTVSGLKKQEAGTSHAELPLDVVEFEYAEITTSAAVDRWNQERDRCQRRTDAALPTVVNLLPQQEYEVVVRTRISVRHTTTEAETAPVEERIAFVTAGPPGLNEAEATGQDLAPYVRSAHAGGRGLLYCEEPVNVAIDGTLRVFGSDAPGEDEHGLRLPLSLAVRPLVDTSEREVTKATFESEDWFVAHRSTSWLRTTATLTTHSMVALLSADARALRMKQISTASTGDCPIDPVWLAHLPVFWAQPFGADATATRWAQARRYRASLRRQNAPVVRREPFVAADVTALRAVVGGWRISDDGALVPTSPRSTAYFGEGEWDHVRVRLVVDLSAGQAVGMLVLGSAEDPARGVRFEVARGQLMAAQGLHGETLTAVPLTNAPSSIELVVETFADAIRCTAGGASVRVSRLGLEPGSCALIAEGATVRALHARGIELYAFDFTTSRYASFEAHVASFDQLERQALEAEAGAPIATLTAANEKVVLAMSPDAADAERERLFQDLAATLLLPLRETIDRVHITDFRRGGEHVFLIESPEPLDCVEEIALQLQEAQALALPRPRGAEDASPETTATRPGIEAVVPHGADVRESLAAHGPPDLGPPRPPGRTIWVTRPTWVLQNALGTRLLVVPRESLGRGDYRLLFALTRRWFKSDDPPTPQTAYIRSASASFRLP